ncbi:hypothetical protein B4Q04_03760 [Zobellia sp. OII3]|nr:hypothetical protein B4Q04_03760 [Zobellia sp. OII3]
MLVVFPITNFVQNYNIFPGIENKVNVGFFFARYPSSIVLKIKNMATIAPYQKENILLRIIS